MKGQSRYRYIKIDVEGITISPWTCTSFPHASENNSGGANVIDSDDVRSFLASTILPCPSSMQPSSGHSNNINRVVVKASLSFRKVSRPLSLTTSLSQGIDSFRDIHDTGKSYSQVQIEQGHYTSYNGSSESHPFPDSFAST